MTTARRLRRDRKRYNAIRRIRRAFARQIVHCYDVRSSYPHAAVESYNDLITDYALLRFRGWARCHCGSRRQPIRLA